MEGCLSGFRNGSHGALAAWSWHERSSRPLPINLLYRGREAVAAWATAVWVDIDINISNSWVSELASCLVRIYSFNPSLKVSKLSPNIHTGIYDDGVGFSAVTLHVVVGATLLRATAVIPLHPERLHMWTNDGTCVPSHTAAVFLARYLVLLLRLLSEKEPFGSFLRFLSICVCAVVCPNNVATSSQRIGRNQEYVMVSDVDGLDSFRHGLLSVCRIIASTWWQIIAVCVAGAGRCRQPCCTASSDYIPEAETGFNVLDNLIQQVGVVVFTFMFACLRIRAGLFLDVMHPSVEQFVVAVAPRRWTKGGPGNGNSVL